ncbi:SusD family protein [bacterium A37T11]|nr:SusD family protein [bacterium A37T11]
MIIDNKIIGLFLIGFFLVTYTSCNDYLDAKSDASLVVPNKVSDLQALLDRTYIMNTRAAIYGEASSDNYYLSNEVWLSLSEADRNLYGWGDEIVYYDGSDNGWSSCYQAVYYANLALEQIVGIDKNTSSEDAWNNVKGSAHFFRGYYFYMVASTWAKAFDENTASSDLGIPLRLNSDFNIRSTRASVKETYEQILTDLKLAVPLLPVMPEHVMRPSKPAAYAMLSRVYLAMREYPQAKLYADSCLMLKSDLMDYGAINGSLSYPIPQFNEETIFYTHAYIAPLDDYKGRIDSFLFNEFDDFDKRKELFFYGISDSSVSFRGSYSSSFSLFVGLATDEVLLNKAECAVRLGDVSGALSDLNALLEKRWIVGTYVPITATSPDEVLALVLTERRKELLMRDLRWMDIKRLNKEGANINLTRNLNGEVYELPANSPKFALPIPIRVIEETGMPQNPRK